MQKDMISGEAGTIRFTDINGRENLLAYNPLQINDWVLLTIVPADLISGSISFYIFRSFLIVGGTALVFLLFLFMIYGIHNESQKRLSHIAFEDGVTGGMNGAAFQAKYQLFSSEQGFTACAVVMMNVRHFKLLNEKLGYAAGNEILKEIYQEIVEHLNADKNEFAARCEMDHFFICMDESSPEIIQQRISELENSINRRLNIMFPGICLSFEAGCYLVDDTKLDIHLFQDRALTAVRYKTEAGLSSCVFYNDSLVARINREQELDSIFEQSVDRCEFQVYLQPKVNLKSERISGAKALVRWNHSVFGIISPADFIPMLERSGKICRLDLYVFEEVCKFYKRRQAEGKTWYPVSVNLSRYHFYEDDFLERFYGNISGIRFTGKLN